MSSVFRTLVLFPVFFEARILGSNDVIYSSNFGFWQTCTGDDGTHQFGSRDSWHSFSPGLAATHMGALGVSEDGAGLFVADGAIPYRYDFGHSLWEALPAIPDGQSILRFAVSPDFDVDATLLAGTVNGVWSSTDGGQSFERSQGFYPLGVTTLDSSGGSGSDGARAICCY